MNRTTTAVLLRSLLASTSVALAAGCATTPEGDTSPTAAPGAVRPLRTATTDEALALVPGRDRENVAKAFATAGPNAEELATAIASVEPEMRPGMAFLIATMPERDLTSLSARFLVDNTVLAYEAWRNAPWGHRISEQMFLQYILPYANVNERRDDWRADFTERFQAKVWATPDPMAGVKLLNDTINDALKVHYHASKRKKPDQSPYESMELGWASCTGLSILLVDACRAAGIPARCVGCPAWKVVQGNHTWVEVFGPDAEGRWRWFNVGDTGSDPRCENWVNERCRTETDPNDWVHSVWAATWRPTGRHFPLPWEWEIEYVPAVNVTRFYSEPVEHRFTAARPGPATVVATWNNETVAIAPLAAGATEVVLHLARNETFTITTTWADGTLDRTDLRP
jgi:transglutaminase-like putative cysteine protease